MSSGAEDESTKADTSIDTDSIRVGKFVLNDEEKLYAIVPKHLIRSTTDLRKLLEYWELAPPNLILEVNESPKNRDKIVTAENAPVVLQSIFLQPDRVNAIDQEDLIYLGGMRVASGEDDKFRYEDDWVDQKAGFLRTLKERQQVPDKDIRPEDYEFINNYLQRKMVQHFSSIVMAAEMTNGWILCHGAPSPNEKVVETAMHATNSFPTVLVVDRLDDYDPESWGRDNLLSVTDSERALARQTIASLKANAKPLRTSVLGKSTSGTKLVMGDRYDMLNRRGVNEGATASSGESAAYSSKELWHKVGDSWVSTFPWKRGTHFIFCDGYEEFEASTLGQAGYLCFSGHADTQLGRREVRQPRRTGFMIREAMLSVKPCILFNNTGAETQMYARLIREIVKNDMRRNRESIERAGQHVTKKIDKAKRASIVFDINLGEVDRQLDVDYYSKLKYRLRKMVWDLRDAANNGQTGVRLVKKVVPDREEQADEMEPDLHVDSAGPSASPVSSKKASDGTISTTSTGASGYQPIAETGGLNLADVMQIIDLYCDNPRLFQKVVVTVDPINDSPEDVVRRLTSSYARCTMESREVGAGDADDRAVRQAWAFMLQLRKSKWRKRITRDALYIIYILAGFMTTTVAIIDQAYAPRGVQWVAMSLALIVSVCSGVLGLTKADSQLGRIRTSQAKIQYEIHRFRMRVGQYSLNAIERQQEEEAAQKAILEGKKRSVDDKDPRRNRSQSLSKAMHTSRKRFSEAVSSVIQEMMSLDLWYHSSLEHQSEEEDDVGALKVCVAKRLHLNETEARDYISLAIAGQLSPDDYHKVRVVPLLRHMENREDRLRMKTRLLQIGSMLCSSAAVIFGAANEILVIPAVVALATVLFQFLKVYDLERRFEIASSAARELRALDGNWRSLSPLDQQSRLAKSHLVATCEQLALQYRSDSVIQVDRGDVGTEPFDRNQFQANGLSEMQS